MDSKNIEDIYTLSPTQQGMLFHILSAPDSGIYLEQTLCTLHGFLNISAFEQAWQQLVERHPSLRTAFIWKGLDKPRQIIHRRAKLLMERYDWCGLSPATGQAQLQDYLQKDRRRGFELSQPPLMRLTLISITTDTYQLIWSTCHLLLDAWCLNTILKEFFSFYEALCQGQNLQLEPSHSYRDFVTWLKQQDLSEAEGFWRTVLQGFKIPTPLGLGTDRRIGNSWEGGFSQQQTKLSSAITAALKSLARQHHLTLNTLMQGAWVVLLNHYSGKQDIVFGTVVSGRPPELLGIESIVGLFINTLPLRVKFSPNDLLMPWLKNLQSQQITLRQYQHSPLTQVQRWSDVPKGLPLFESILVFQNFAIDISRLSTGNLKISNVHSLGHSNYPLTIRITPSSELLLEVIYDIQRFPTAEITRMLEYFEAVLSFMVTQPDSQLSALSDLLSQIQKKQKTRELKERRQLFANKLKDLQPKAVKLSRNKLVNIVSISSQDKFPLVIQPNSQNLELSTWTQENLDFIEKHLLKHGGILFRNFNIDSIAAFKQFIQSIYPKLLAYRERSTPRTEMGGSIYTSTEYPAHQTIAFHNEFSYADTWPMKICFHCVKSAEQGGETPIADSRKVFQLLDPKIKEQFIQKKVMYVRNYGTGIDLSWQEVFQTTNKSEVEEYCRKAAIEFLWTGNNGLKTRQVRHAVAQHPKTGEMVWFNQAHLFHASNLEPEVLESMLQAFQEEDLPRHAYYGDGSIIEPSTLDAIREAYQQASVSFIWQEGDVLLLDNMLVAHGRKPFTGTRKIVVAMAEAFTQ